MKKRVMALALCLLVCLPLILTACGNKFVDAVANTKVDDKTSYTTTVEKDLKGLSPDLEEKFLFTVDVDANDNMKKTYRVYNALNGEEIFKEKVTSDEDETKSISFRALTEDLFCLGFTTFVFEDYSTETTYTIYNTNGGTVYTDLEEVPTYISNLAADAFIIGDSLYFYEDGKMTMKKSLKETVVDETLLRSLTVAGDKYIKVAGSKIFAFNSDFEQIDVQTFKTNSENYYSQEDSNSFVLNNGNVLVQVKSTVGAYSDVFDADYDYVEDGTCYILDTYLYNTKKLNYKEIKLNYYITGLQTADECYEANDYGFVNDAENKAEAYKIDGEEIVYGVNNDGKVTIYLSNDAKAEEFEITDEGTRYVALSDTRYLVYGDYFTRLYDAKNELVGELGTITAYNKNFIVTPNAIYKTENLQSVVTFDEYTEYVGATVDTIVYKVTDEDGEEVQYLAVSTSGSQLIAESNEDVKSNIQVNQYYIGVTSTEYDDFVAIEKTVSVWTTAGVEIDSITVDLEGNENIQTVATETIGDNTVMVFIITESGNKGISQEVKLVVLGR